MLQGSSLNKIDQRRHATRLSRVTSSVGWRRSQETGHLTFFIFDIALLFPVPFLGLPIASCPHKHNTLNTLPSLLGLLLLLRDVNRMARASTSSSRGSRPRWKG